MAFIDDCLAQERDEREERIRQNLYDRFLEGKTDAAFGRMPKYNESVYLDGYLAGLKELPIDPKTQKIQRHNSNQPFAYGFVDTPLLRAPEVDRCHLSRLQIFTPYSPTTCKTRRYNRSLTQNSALLIKLSRTGFTSATKPRCFASINTPKIPVNRI